MAKVEENDTIGINMDTNRCSGGTKLCFLLSLIG